MFRILFFILLINHSFAWDFDPMRTTKANKAKEQASEAFAKKNYEVAISRYKYLLDTLKIQDERAQLNLAHCYMRKADYTNAQNYYISATKLVDSKLRSIAFQQLGILASEKENKEEAIANFKNALKCNPANNQARFNYELIVKNKKQETPKSDDKQDRDKEEKKNKDQEKKQDEQKKEDQKKKDEQEKKDQENKEDKKGGDKNDQNKDGKKEDKSGKNDLKQKEKEDEKGKPNDKNKDGKPDDKKEEEKKPGEKKEGEGNKGKENKPDEKGEKKDNVEKPSENKGNQQKKSQAESNRPNKEQLQKMNMTEQQAKAILNAMRQGEAQYIQEMKRVPSKPNSGGNKKDW
jgi:Ca-activated chloride channel homolog